MEKLTKSMPESVREIFDEMTSFNFAGAFANLKVAEVKEYKGHRLQPSFPSDVVEFGYDKWLPRKGDVFIASFPRTGTNWTTEIVHQLIYGRNEELSNLVRSTPLPLLFFEGGTPTKFKIAEHLPYPRRLVSTHLPATIINVDAYTKAGAKFVNVIRNPKDQTLSWFNFSKKLPYLHLEPNRELFQCDWEKFLENYSSGKQPIGLPEGEWYLDHLLSWYSHQNNENVYVVCYEDMKKDLPTEVRKLAKFLEVKLTESEVNSIATKCGFKAMQTASDNKENVSAEYRADIGVLNKGVIGDWKNHFTVAQSEAMDSAVKQKLAGTDIKFTYE